MELMLKDNLIVIGPKFILNSIIKKNNLKYNIKLIDIDELKNKYLYCYKDNILEFIDNKYKYIPEISKEILNTLYLIDENKNYNNKKLDNLVKIKNDLINNKYIIYNENFKNYLKNKDILVIDYYYDSIILKIIEEIKKNNKLTYYKQELEEKEYLIHEANTMEDEVKIVASYIVELVDNGVDINKIKINKLGNYKDEVIKIFDFYNIPNNFMDSNLYNICSVKKLIKSIPLETKIIDTNEYIDNLLNDEIKNKVINIFNKYISYDFSTVKKEIIYELKNTYVPVSNYKNVIEEKDYKNYFPNDDEYFIMLGVNENEIPKLYKDDSYLSNKELKLLDGDTSIIKNNNEEKKFNYFINNTKNLYLSYRKKELDENLNISSALKKYKIIKSKYKYDNQKINEILLGSMLDRYIKFNEDSEILHKLSYNYDISYDKYDNKYNKIDFNTIRKQLNNKLNLSYTDCNTFYECKFKYLLKCIYKLDKFTDSISTRIGNLFHDVLEKYYKSKCNLDNIIDEVVSNYFDLNNNIEKFYSKKYKDALYKLISVINLELENSKYTNTYFEEWFSVEKENDLEVRIVGRIDKILTFKDDNYTYVIVVDYKTGKLHYDFNKVIYGLDMQLLYYLYLIKNSKKIDNPFFTGMYLQTALVDILSNKENKTYDEQLTDELKLQGYTIKNIALLKNIDTKVEEKSYIKGLGIKLNGDFKESSKVLTEEEIDKLIDIVSKNIDEAIIDIKNSNFEINPIKIENELIGCMYCPFKDICYKTNNDIKETSRYKDLEFLGGDNSDTNKR